MSWKKVICLLVGVGLLVIGFSVSAFAYDGRALGNSLLSSPHPKLTGTVPPNVPGNKGLVRVQAPLDAINCQATPATVSLLGLTIDVSKASFVGSERRHRHGNNLTCANLTAGQAVEVQLTGDTPDPSTGLLTATEVDVSGDRDNDVTIVAPLQIIDPTGTNVTVLGLVVDISKATLVNDKEHSIVVSQLKVGQIAMLELPSNQAPLSAATLLVHINEVKVQAPIDAINCQATPATVSLLGLTVDVSKASFVGSERRHENGNNLTCANVTVGQAVEVYLISDTLDPASGMLTATEVDGSGDDDNGVTIAGPLQVIDPAGTTVTVLGLIVDISKTTLLNDKEESIMTSQLKVGQFAMLELPSNQAPLSAATLLVHIDEAKVQAPIDAINCQATPATVSLLGLTVDVSKASFIGSERRHEDGDNFTCANLTVGQVVVIELVSNTPDPATKLLTATEIEVLGDQDNGVKIAAPIEAIDPTGTTVTVLGLVVDISKATLLDDNVHSITASQLAVGQFVELDLASNQTPLSAALLVAESGINAVHVFVMDEHGKPVNDAGADVRAEVTVIVAKKVLKINATSNGVFHLAALPAGRATVVVTRVHNGKTSKATAAFMVNANANHKLSIRLKIVR